MEPIYKRILLKISGEALAGEQGFGINTDVLDTICTQIKEVHDLGLEIGLVVGGGNIWRGLSGSRKGMDRSQADYMGMLATVINSLALQDCLESKGIPTRVQTAIEMREVAAPYIRRRAVRHLERGRIVIFGAGTGNPYFSTDTTAALRAAEIGAEIIFKATKVDGVYDKDPMKFEDAKKYDSLSYIDVIKNGLGVMDSTATTLCMDNHIPILVFDLNNTGNIKRAVMGEPIGTIVKED